MLRLCAASDLRNPLLLDGFKWDMRLYVLVTSFDPLGQSNGSFILLVSTSCFAAAGVYMYELVLLKGKR